LVSENFTTFTPPQELKPHRVRVYTSSRTQYKHIHIYIYIYTHIERLCLINLIPEAPIVANEHLSDEIESQGLAMHMALHIAIPDRVQ
jgi:hypothetical protein